MNTYLSSVGRPINDSVDIDYFLLLCFYILMNPERGASFLSTRELLDNSLVQSGYSGAGTEKYFVDGCPEVLVRLNKGESVETFHRAITYYKKIGAFGIGTLDFNVVPHKGEAYVFTEIVHGVGLADALRTNPRLKSIADTAYAGVIKYHTQTYLLQEPVIADVLSPEQYMYGYTASKQEDTVFAVDLSPYSGRFINDDASYLDDLITLTEGVQELEEASGQIMPYSRTQLADAVFALPPH